MAFTDTADLIAQLKLEDKFSGPLKNAQKSLKGFDAKLDDTATRGYRAGQQIGTGIKNGLKIAAAGFGLLLTQVGFGLQQLVQLEEVNAQTVAGLKSTKDASGQTATSIRNLAEQYENLNAVIDDKVIQSGENVLLTFTKVGKEVFPQAVLAALDLSTAMGQDLQTSIVQIGKALNDPVNGFTALRRVGIQFTADQEKQIKALQESGDLLGAQKIILQELGTEFGGRFAAQGRTAKGTIAGIGDAVEDLQKSLATALFPTVQRLLPKFRDALTSPAFITGVGRLGDAIAGLFSEKNIQEGTKALEGLFKVAKDVAPVIQNAAEITGQVVKTAVGLFRSLPPELQALAVAGLAVNKLTGGLVTNIAGGLISAVISSFKGLMNVNAASVIVNGPVGGVGAAAGGGLISTAAGLAVPVTILAIGAEAATQLANADIAGKGFTGKFETPGSGILPFGIEASLRNIATALGIFNQNSQRGPLSKSGHFLERTVEDRSLDAIEKLRGAIQFNTDATRDSTDAAKRLTRAQAQEVISADQRARGIKFTGHSTSLAPRFNFLRQAQSGAKDVAVANAIAQGFERGSTPLFRKTSLIPTAIKELKRDQRQLLKAGDTKNAALIGADIDRLTGVLRRKKLSLTTNVSVPVSVKQFINGRLVDAATGRFTSTIVGSRGAFREFG